ncbi:MAG: poly-gamma-glutamate hydrolase family protein [Armatimonadota bacterium]
MSLPRRLLTITAAGVTLAWCCCAAASEEMDLQPITPEDRAYYERKLRQRVQANWDKFDCEWRLQPGARILVVAPHGKIEIRTREIAQALARELDASYYCFYPTAPRADLTWRRDHEPRKGHPFHITSTKLQAPKLEDLLAKHDVCISVHGMVDSPQADVAVGGRLESLRDGVIRELVTAGIPAKIAWGNLKGTSRSNFVNRCRTRQGVQLEIGRKLRSGDDPSPRRAIVEAVVRACAARATSDATQ